MVCNGIAKEEAKQPGNLSGNKDFDSHFPILMNEMRNFYTTVNIAELRQIKEWKEVNKLFYGEQMSAMLERVDVEVKAAIGDYWDKLKS